MFTAWKLLVRVQCGPPRAPLTDRAYANPLIADAPGTCSVPVTVADLQSSPGTWDGRVVAVLDGWVVGGPAGCTEIACAPSMPCCNSCFSSELFSDTRGGSGVALRDMASVPYECTGDECMPYTACTQPVDLRYRLIARFVAAMGGYREVRSIVMLP